MLQTSHSAHATLFVSLLCCIVKQCPQRITTGVVTAPAVPDSTLWRVPLLQILVSRDIASHIEYALIPKGHASRCFSSTSAPLGLLRLELVRLVLAICNAVFEYWLHDVALEHAFSASEQQDQAEHLRALLGACTRLTFHYPKQSILHCEILALYRALFECFEETLARSTATSISPTGSISSTSPASASGSPGSFASPNSATTASPLLSIRATTPLTSASHQQCAALLLDIFDSEQLIEKLIAGASDPSDAHNAFCTQFVYEIDNRSVIAKAIEQKMPPVLLAQWLRTCEQANARIEVNKTRGSKHSADTDMAIDTSRRKKPPWWFSIRNQS